MKAWPEIYQVCDLCVSISTQYNPFNGPFPFQVPSAHLVDSLHILMIAISFDNVSKAPENGMNPIHLPLVELCISIDESLLRMRHCLETMGISVESWPGNTLLILLRAV